MSVPWLDEVIVPQTIVIAGTTYELEFREYPTLQREAYWNPVYRHLWEEINNEAGQWLVDTVVASALAYASFLVYQFYAKSNGGKSWLMIAKAIELKMFQEALGISEEVYIHYVFSHAEIGELLRNGSNPDIPRKDKALKGDIICCDEESALSGQGSLNTEGALSNVLKSVRAYGVHFFFSDPDPSPKPNIDACFRIVAIARKANVTISILEEMKDGKNYPIGFDVSEIPVESGEWERQIALYLPLKMANIKKIIASGGFVGTNASQEQVVDAERLLKLIKEKQEEALRADPPYRVKVTRDSLDTWAMDLNITGHGTAYTTNVVTRVLEIRNQQKGIVTKTPEYMGQVKDFQKAMYARLEERGVPKRDVTMLKMNCEGSGQDDIAAIFGCSQPTVSKKIRKIGQNEIGYAWEDVYSVWLSREGIKHKMGGSNTPEPDCVLLDENDEPIEVISLKCRICKRGINTVPRKDIAKSELKMRDDLGIPLHLLMFDIKSGTLHDKVLVTDQERFTFRAD